MPCSGFEIVEVGGFECGLCKATSVTLSINSFEDVILSASVDIEYNDNIWSWKKRLFCLHNKTSVRN